MRRKLFFLILSAILQFLPVYAESNMGQASPVYSPRVLSVGYGFYSYDFDNWGGSKGPLMLKYEQRLNHHLGLGVNVAGGRKISNVLGNADQKTTFFSALVRGNYYFELNSQVESYVGMGVGIRNTLPLHKPSGQVYNRKDGLAIPDNLLGLEATIGLRYHLLSKLSFYTEAGFSKGLIQFGACYHW